MRPLVLAALVALLATVVSRVNAAVPPSSIDDDLVRPSILVLAERSRRRRLHVDAEDSLLLSLTREFQHAHLPAVHVLTTHVHANVERTIVERVRRTLPHGGVRALVLADERHDYDSDDEARAHLHDQLPRSLPIVQLNSAAVHPGESVLAVDNVLHVPRCVGGAECARSDYGRRLVLDAVRWLLRVDHERDVAKRQSTTPVPTPVPTPGLTAAELRPSALFRNNATGLQGSEFLVSSLHSAVDRSDTGAQVLDSVSLGGRSWAAVWSAGDGSNNGVFLQIYDDAEVPLYDEPVRVNDITDGSQGTPTIAALGDGEQLVVTWASWTSASGDVGILAQRYNARTGARIDSADQSTPVLPSRVSAGGSALLPYSIGLGDGSGQWVLCYLRDRRYWHAIVFDGVTEQRDFRISNAVQPDFLPNSDVFAALSNPEIGQRLRGARLPTGEMAFAFSLITPSTWPELANQPVEEGTLYILRDFATAYSADLRVPLTSDSGFPIAPIQGRYDGADGQSVERDGANYWCRSVDIAPGGERNSFVVVSSCAGIESFDFTPGSAGSSAARYGITASLLHLDPYHGMLSPHRRPSSSPTVPQDPTRGEVRRRDDDDNDAATDGADDADAAIANDVNANLDARRAARRRRWANGRVVPPQHVRRRGHREQKQQQPQQQQQQQHQQQQQQRRQEQQQQQQHHHHHHQQQPALPTQITVHERTVKLSDLSLSLATPLHAIYARAHRAHMRATSGEHGSATTDDDNVLLAGGRRRRTSATSSNAAMFLRGASATRTPPRPNNTNDADARQAKRDHAVSAPPEHARTIANGFETIGRYAFTQGEGAYQFEVNDYQFDFQEQSTVTYVPNVGFLVVWTSYFARNGDSGQDGSAHGVYAASFDIFGQQRVVGLRFSATEFDVQVNTETRNRQENPSVLASEDGQAIYVFWTSLNQVVSGAAVIGQRFDAFLRRVDVDFESAPRGSEFWVADDALSDPSRSSYAECSPLIAAADPSGSLPSHALGHQQNGRGAVLADGSYVLVWQSLDPAPQFANADDHFDVFMRRFLSNGCPATPVVSVASETALQQARPALHVLRRQLDPSSSSAAASSTGVEETVVVAWASRHDTINSTTSRESSIWFSYFDATTLEKLTAGDRRANKRTGHPVDRPSLSQTRSGDLLMVWDVEDYVDTTTTPSTVLGNRTVYRTFVGSRAERSRYGEPTMIDGEELAYEPTSQVATLAGSSSMRATLAKLDDGNNVLCFDTDAEARGRLAGPTVDERSIWCQLLADATSADDGFEQPTPQLSTLRKRQTTTSSSADVVPQGMPFPVNAYTQGEQVDAHVAPVNGGFVVTYLNNEQGLDGGGTSSLMSFFTNAGTRFGSEEIINTHTSRAQQNPMGMQLPQVSNEVLFVYESGSFDASDFSVVGQRFTYSVSENSTQKIGDEVLLNTQTAYSQQEPFVFPLIDGGYIATWASVRQSPDDTVGMVGQRFDHRRAKVRAFRPLRVNGIVDVVFDEDQDEALSPIDVETSRAELRVDISVEPIDSGRLSTAFLGGVQSLFNDTSGTWTAQGALPGMERQLESIVWLPSADYDGTAQLQYTIDDGDAMITATATFTATPENDRPRPLARAPQQRARGSTVRLDPFDAEFPLFWDDDSFDLPVAQRQIMAVALPLCQCESAGTCECSDDECVDAPSFCPLGCTEQRCAADELDVEVDADTKVITFSSSSAQGSRSVISVTLVDTAGQEASLAVEYQWTEGDDSGLSDGALAGIIIAIVLVVLILLIILAVLLWRKRRIDAILAIDEDDLVELELLGQGAFGKVYRGTWRNADVAIKRIEKDGLKKEDVDEFKSEVRILASLAPHPNVVQFLGMCTHRNARGVSLVTELVATGSLDKYLKSHYDTLSVDSLIEMAAGVAAGMSHIGKSNIVHLDLAARNVLIEEKMKRIKDDDAATLTSTGGSSRTHTMMTADGEMAHMQTHFVAKVTDFGLSKNAAKLGKKTKMPLRWTAPEVLLDIGKATPSSDIWSFGITTWEIMTGCQYNKPYPNMNNGQVLQALKDGYKMPKPSNTPHGVYQVMLGCWQEEPAWRLSFDSIQERLKEVLGKGAEARTLDSMAASTFMAWTDWEDDAASGGSNGAPTTAHSQSGAAPGIALTEIDPATGRPTSPATTAASSQSAGSRASTAAVTQPPSAAGAGEEDYVTQDNVAATQNASSTLASTQRSAVGATAAAGEEEDDYMTEDAVAATQRSASKSATRPPSSHITSSPNATRPPSQHAPTLDPTAGEDDYMTHDAVATTRASGAAATQPPGAMMEDFDSTEESEGAYM